jgi:hypothetical protein
MQIVDFQLPIVNTQHGQAAANPLEFGVFDLICVCFPRMYSTFVTVHGVICRILAIFGHCERGRADRGNLLAMRG